MRRCPDCGKPLVRYAKRCKKHAAIERANTRRDEQLRQLAEARECRWGRVEMVAIDGQRLRREIGRQSYALSERFGYERTYLGVCVRRGLIDYAVLDAICCERGLHPSEMMVDTPLRSA